MDSMIIFLCFIVILTASALYGKYPDKRIYVYDSNKWRSVVRAGQSKRDPHELLDKMKNHGAGPVTNISQGSYHTDQYQLFSMFYHRLLKDPRRTLDPREATSFFIPYDLASDAAFYKMCPKTINTCFELRKCPLASTVETLLAESKWFARNGGNDHVLIVGMNYAMDYYIGKPKCKALLSGICRNCTKFAIDDYSYMYGDDEGILSRGDHWHATPFPSDFHWTRHVQPPFPWEFTDRPLLVSYVGSSRSYYNPARRLRGSIIHYCELHPNLCVHQTYGLNGTRSSFLVHKYNPLELSKKSVFCFQPIGDLMTRKGLFDSLLQGCIPVTFDLLTASVMYIWHWEESFWKNVTIEYAFQPTAHRYFDPVLSLQEMLQNNSSVISNIQAMIRKRVFQLQYSLEGRYQEWFDEMKINPYTNRSIAFEDHYISKYWPRDDNGEPLDDAYDIAVDLILGWHSGELVDYRNATVPECWGKAHVDKIENRCKLDS